MSKKFWLSLRRFSLLYGVALILLLTCLCIPILVIRAAVTLNYFIAVSGNNQVTLKWLTSTELNNVGFFVQRSLQRDGTYSRINTEIIPAQGDGFTGALYEYVDSGVTNGTQFWYRLESIDSGQQSTYSDPVSAVPGLTGTLTTTPSPTNTNATPSLTNTRTPTSVNFNQPTPTITSRITPSPSPNQPYPGPTQANILATSPTPPNSGGVLTTTPPTGENELANGPTATLIPFPTITIAFPPTPNISAPLPDLSGADGSLPSLQILLGLWPLGLVLLIWIGLGVWFYFSHRNPP